MASKAYDEILQRARQELSEAEQLKLINDLCRGSTKNGGHHRITELRGLGKELWKDVDPSEYIREERDAWSG